MIFFEDHEPCYIINLNFSKIKFCLWSPHCISLDACKQIFASQQNDKILDSHKVYSSQSVKLQSVDYISISHCSRPWVGCVRLRLKQHYSVQSHNKLLKHKQNSRSAVDLVYAQLTSWKRVDMWGMGPSSLFFKRRLHSIRVIREMMKMPRSGVRSLTMLQGSSSGSLQKQPQTQQ